MTTLFIIVALALAGVGTYITRRDPKWGTPILVGIAIITVLYLVWDHDPSRSQTVDPPPTSTAGPPCPRRPDCGTDGRILPAPERRDP
ncbi:hypothetical protein ABZ864_25405 [Streptomyces sp. NPDC047082]|uniref:hypothetical protein n=1 Tax=Streptomyces sp. NPDC047082 TaxID=3155259 RepID=UPI0033CC68C0